MSYGTDPMVLPVALGKLEIHSRYSRSSWQIEFWIIASCVQRQATVVDRRPSSIVLTMDRRGDVVRRFENVIFHAFERHRRSNKNLFGIVVKQQKIFRFANGIARKGFHRFASFLRWKNSVEEEKWSMRCSSLLTKALRHLRPLTILTDDFLVSNPIKTRGTKIFHRA